MQTHLVIVVEDDPTLRELVAEHLRGVGFEVLAFANGDAALRMIRDRRPDLVCLDLNLPSVSGFDLCEQIRSDPLLNDIAILMTSATVFLEARAYSLEAGADAYLRKPYTLRQLTSEIARLLDAPPGSARRSS
jgi:two-component system chemotaxis response regulator CheY